MNADNQAEEGASAQLPESGEQDRVGERQAEMNHQLPQVLRFCPSLSTREIDISVSGKS